MHDDRPLSAFDPPPAGPLEAPPPGPPKWPLAGAPERPSAGAPAASPGRPLDGPGAARPSRRRHLLAGAAAWALRGGRIGAGGTVAGALSLGGCATRPGDDAGRPITHRGVDRLGWGASPRQMAEATAAGWQAWWRDQLDPRHPERLPPAVQARLASLDSLATAPDQALAELAALRREDERERRATPPPPAPRQRVQEELQRRSRQAVERHLLRALWSDRQLHARMSAFWLNHFSVFQHKGNLRALVADYEEQAIRPHALTDFRALLGAVTRHPAMLRYLDNEHNRAGRGNENHARELLELHTLGVHGGYTQQDVQELARVLTGHTLRGADEPPPRLKPAWQPLWRAERGWVFDPARHDFGDKRVLGLPVHGSGADELDAVLDHLCAQPATAHHVCRRLAIGLLGDAPPAAQVARMVRAFGPRGDLQAVLATLLDDRAFTDGPPAFKPPTLWLLSALRAGGADDAAPGDLGPLIGWMNRLGEGVFERGTPDGWPLEAAAWYSAAQLEQRFEIAQTIVGQAGRVFTTVRPEATPAAGPQRSTSMPMPAATATPTARATAMPVRDARAPLAWPLPLAGRTALRPQTRQVLLQAEADPRQRDALLLCSPDLMER